MGTGINGAEFMVLLLLAIVLIGPEKLPELAQQLGRLTRELKALATGARARVREELGPEFDDMDLSVLDPRQYDPRRIVREALMDDEPPARPGGRPARPRADRRPRPAITPVSAAPTASAAPPSLATVAGAGVAGAAGAAGAAAAAPSGSAAPHGSTAVAADDLASDSTQAPTAAVGAPGQHGAGGSTAVSAAHPPATAPAAPAAPATPATSTTSSGGATGQASASTSAPRRPIRSPRDIVARTRGVVPAAESPAVLAALGGMAADAASDRAPGDAVSTPAPAPDAEAAQAQPAGAGASGTPEPAGDPGGSAGEPAYVVPYDDEAT